MVGGIGHIYILNNPDIAHLKGANTCSFEHNCTGETTSNIHFKKHKLFLSYWQKKLIF